MKNHAFRKLQRTPSHRGLMLRNMVSSLIEHEQIQTTVPKAKEAARLAEKIITIGKKGDRHARNAATGFLMSPKKTVPKLFDVIGPRYISRPGGYTRIHLFGNRPGDNAPTAVLELVDNPYDIKLEMVARAVARENFLQRGVGSAVGPEGKAQDGGLLLIESPVLREFTRRNVKKLFRSASSSPSPSPSSANSTSILERLEARARHHLAILRAQDTLPPWGPNVEKYESLKVSPLEDPSQGSPARTLPTGGRRRLAGEAPSSLAESIFRTGRTGEEGASMERGGKPRGRRARWSTSPIGIARGAFARRPLPRVEAKDVISTVFRPRDADESGASSGSSWRSWLKR